jgi:hypothetical protein
MRFLSLIPALVVVLFTSGASAQVWEEYVNRENFFTVNLPGEPTMTEVPYTTSKGTKLMARVFTANAAADSILAGKYSMTVVDYSAAPMELASALEEVAVTERKKGAVKYDGGGMVDNIKSWRMTIETPANRRILTEILAHGTRLYIVEADTPLNVPPPAQFQASVQILDENGVRIRYRSVGSTERVR